MNNILTADILFLFVANLPEIKRKKIKIVFLIYQNLSQSDIFYCLQTERKEVSEKTAYRKKPKKLVNKQTPAK